MLLVVQTLLQRIFIFDDLRSLIKYTYYSICSTVYLNDLPEIINSLETFAKQNKKYDCKFKHVLPRTNVSKISRNSEAFTSEFLEYLEEMFPRY